MADEPNFTAPATEPAPVPVQPAPAPAVEPVAPVVTPAPATPAPDNSRVREQFEKLLESNRRLMEANLALESEKKQRVDANKTFAPIQTPTPTPAQVNAEDFVEIDPATGERFLNEAKLQQKINEVNEIARTTANKFESYIQNAEQRESQRQEQETYQAYPELDPGPWNADKFDRELHKLTRSILTDSYVNPVDYGNRNLSFKEAADIAASKLRGTQTPVVTAQAPAPAPENDGGLKDQASASVPSQPAPQARASQADEAELTNLRMATRYGSDEALAQRILATDHAFRDRAEEA